MKRGKGENSAQNTEHRTQNAIEERGSYEIGIFLNTKYTKVHNVKMLDWNLILSVTSCTLCSIKQRIYRKFILST